MSRYRQIATDAAHDLDAGVAGIGVGYLGNPYAIIRAGIVPVSSTAEGELKAIIDAFELMADAKVGPGAVVYNDNAAVVGLLRGLIGNSHNIDRGVIATAARLMEIHGFEVRFAKRGRTKSAHRAARISLAAWRQGRQVVERAA